MSDHTISRREVLKLAAIAAGGLAVPSVPGLASPSAKGDPFMSSSATAREAAIAALPVGSAPEPLIPACFPSAAHAVIWRNWELVSATRIASVLCATPEAVTRAGCAMGLAGPPDISADRVRRSYITVIRRNWHLLPYNQLLDLLGWTPEKLAYYLKEDDFLWHKLGDLKPHCAPVLWKEPDAAMLAREQQIAQVMRQDVRAGCSVPGENLFKFVEELSSVPEHPDAAPAPGVFSPRYCYSYFALYGDPLLETATDPYPDGYLARLAACGVDGIWLQGVLSKLTPFALDMSLSEGWETRLANLRKLIARARRHGMGVYLYLNEPRAMPLSFFQKHPDLKGAQEGEFAALCTSTDEVRGILRQSVERLCREAPDLAGIFTITASENLTSCWSHFNGSACPRCSKRTPAEVIAEVNQVFYEGIQASGAKTRLLAWDWAWGDWAEDAIRRLPAGASMMCVSEWGMPITRGGIQTAVGEYSISTVGPGERARRHWALARERGMKTMAKIQAGNTWELSAVPYIPAVENVARHAANLRDAGVDGLMLGWTLGGYPSPNLEVVAEIGRDKRVSPEDAMRAVATRRYGEQLAGSVVEAWRTISRVFSEFPFNGGLCYLAPLQMGPANLLWERPTGYRATMVGIPYDDAANWYGPYPPDVFVRVFADLAKGFDAAGRALRQAAGRANLKPDSSEARAVDAECGIIEAASIHFRTVSNQALFVQTRDALKTAKPEEAEGLIGLLESLLRDELSLARRLRELQAEDSRIGFEASNHYFYVGNDLAEKVLNCQDLLDRWLPAERKARGI